MAAAIEILNSDALNAALNVIWIGEILVMGACLASRRLRHCLQRRFWS